jgi:hypothetical protein
MADLTNETVATLIERLEAASCKKFPDVTVKRLYELLKCVDVVTASNIVSGIEDIERIPVNIVSVVKNTIKEKKQKKIDWQDKPITQELMATPEEAIFFTKIVVLILRARHKRMIKINENGYCGVTVKEKYKTVTIDTISYDLDNWIKAGKPQTMFELVDYLLNGWMTVYKNNNTSTEYLKQFYDFMEEKLNGQKRNSAGSNRCT